MPSEWIAVVFSYNNLLPVIFDVFRTKNEAKQLFVKACGFDVDMEPEKCFDGCFVELNVDQYCSPIINSSMFKKSDAEEHFTHDKFCKPQLLICEKDKYSVNEIISAIVLD